MHYNPAAHGKSGRGSARLERTVRVREVPSSNLGAPTREEIPNILGFKDQANDPPDLSWRVVAFSTVYHTLG